MMDYKLAMAYESVHAATAFDQITGNKGLMKVEVGYPTASSYFRFGYAWEINRRHNLDLGTEFQSYSPTRNTLYFHYRDAVAGNWYFETGVNYGKSVYSDQNIVLNPDNSLTIMKRKDDRLFVTARVEYAFSKGSTGQWLAFSEYRYTRNHSNFDLYGYSKNQFSLGLRSTF